jgi:hypothetical protein
MGTSTYMANNGILPNDLENAKATVKALSNLMNKLKNKRAVLTGDFNSTETKSFYDTGGPLPPTNAKNTNAATVQTILDTYGFKDLWIHRDNEARELESLETPTPHPLEPRPHQRSPHIQSLYKLRHTGQDQGHNMAPPRVRP